LATGWTLDYIDSLPAYQMREWRIYDALFPFGDDRADMRMGVKLQRPKTQAQIDNELRHRLRSSVKE